MKTKIKTYLGSYSAFRAVTIRKEKETEIKAQSNYFVVLSNQLKDVIG